MVAPLVIRKPESGLRQNPPIQPHAVEAEYDETIDAMHTFGGELSTPEQHQRPAGALFYGSKPGDMPPINVVRFVDIPKLGLNPNNEYDTPTGLYWYPFDNFSSFAIDRPYRIEAQLVGWGVDLDLVTDDHVDEVLHRFSLDREMLEIESLGFIEEFDNEIGASWWAATRLAALKRFRKQWGKRELVNVWTSVLRELCDFVVDKGNGIIHKNEPSQVLSFETRIARNVKLFENKDKMAWDSKKKVWKRVEAEKDVWDYVVRVTGSKERGYRLWIHARGERKPTVVDDLTSVEKVLLPGVVLEDFSPRVGRIRLSINDAEEEINSRGLFLAVGRKLLIKRLDHISSATNLMLDYKRSD